MMQRRTQGNGIIKGWEGKQDQGCIPDTYFIYLSNKDQNPATAGSACINAKEREKKERIGRRAKKKKGIKTEG